MNFFLREKLEFIWPYIDRIGKSTMEIVDDMLEINFSLYEKFSRIKSGENYTSPYHIPLNAISDISDEKQYNLLVRYTKYFINVYANWIFMDFASPQEIVTETFIRLKNENIKEYNTEIVLKYIWRVCDKMWRDYLNSHPKYNELLRRKNKNNNSKRRSNLSTSYVVEIASKNKKYKNLTKDEIRNSSEILTEVRQRILGKRNCKEVSDFISHFD